MVKKWNIYFLDLDPIKGSEQRGKRPVLAISNDAVNAALPVFTCLPFSSVKPGMKIYPTEVYISASDSGLSRDSVVMLHQIRTVSTSRIIGDAIGEIKDTALRQQINRALTQYFDLS